ncbi:restriction endonuclease subunit S [Bifidobacterium catenulatum]|uniref:restriction endonuclease subunit S n=2 Tax=Bifidobacterium catenulatum TaxID=1686 RepID=UPI0023EB903A|nr:restriction endonuclease subunit S [Bifidobacterium catenulatum]MDF4093042.1 restriction endonuclease subunit S [Bifidobacterium catenulatum]
MKSSKPQFVEERGQKVKLNNLCSRGKSSLRQKDVSNDGPYAVYGASGLVGTMASFQNTVPYVAVVKDGAGVGRASACEANTSVLGTMQALIPREGIDRDYLLHLVRSLHLGDGFSGSTIPHIYFKDYGKLPVRLHSPAEQKRIVDIFASIERQIKVSKQQLDQLDSLVKSRFVEMFGDPCDANGNKAKVKVASICELRIGPFGSALHKNDYISGGHPLINPSHIIGSSIIPDADLTVSDDKYKSLEAYHLLPGDIVLGRRGEIGRCAVVQDKGFLCGTGSMVLRPRAGVRSEYLQRVVSFPSFRQALERNAVGVTMKNLNAKIVGAADMCLPSINQQDDFISFTKQVDKSRFGGMLHLLNNLSGIMQASFFSITDAD